MPKRCDEAAQRVLVVDDEELIADSVAAIPNRNGYRATATYSAEAAINSSRQSARTLSSPI
jgi:DNA-binding response OmpR family regulator